MHYGGIGTGVGYPDSEAIGAVRLWDTGTAWRDVQPARHTWNWSVLDRAVAKARAHGDSVLYVLGFAPAWAAKPVPVRRGETAILRGSPPRKDADWVAYVAAVAKRYKGRIGAYEVWNEANLNGFFGGTIPRMVRLASLANRTIKRIDRHAIVTSPSATVRGATGRRWMRNYARAGGLRWADVINQHLYPHPDAGPEAAIDLLRDFRAHMRRVPGGSKAIWNTEINYGLRHLSTHRRVPISADDQVAFVLRTYLLGWTNGLRRVYWYDWSSARFLGVRMTTGSGATTAASPGQALLTAERWMGGRVGKCTSTRRGLYTCLIDYGRGRRGVVHWNPRRASPVTAPRGTTSWVDQLGVSHPVTARLRMAVGGAPVLFRYRL